MTENQKIIELIIRLNEAFPGEYIDISKHFRSFPPNTNIGITFSVYIESFGRGPVGDIIGIPGLEAYVDMVIINKVSKEK